MRARIIVDTALICRLSDHIYAYEIGGYRRDIIVCPGSPITQLCSSCISAQKKNFIETLSQIGSKSSVS